MHHLAAAQPHITLAHGRPVTTSLDIAEHFGKEHRNVLRACRDAECSEEFKLLNFEQHEYIAGNGSRQPLFHITRDGFVFLAMGFTGAEAARWKEAYIRAFNAMEAQLMADMPRPGQVEAVQLRRVARELGEELLRQAPYRRKLLRYRRMGLGVREIGRLLQRSPERIRKDIHLLEACDLLQVTPELRRQRQVALANLRKVTP